MAGLPWFALASDFPTHPKTVRLALRLRDRNAGMYVVRLLAFCAQHVPTGRLDGEDAEAIIESACEWKGRRRGALVEALVACEFLESHDNSYTVHGWLERNSAHVRKRERDAVKPRGNKPRPPAVPRGTGAGPARESERERDNTDPPVVPRSQSRWEDVLEQLRSREQSPEDRSILRRWLEPLESEEADGVVRLLAPTEHHLAFVRDNYRERLEALLDGARLEFGVRKGAA